MTEFSNQPENITDQQLGALFNVLGPVRRDPDHAFEYDDDAVNPINYVLGQLQTRHGLKPKQVLTRLLAASELSVRIQELVEFNVDDGMFDLVNGEVHGFN